MQKLLVFQSMWSMERHQTDGVERSLEESVAMIAAAGFDGVSAGVPDRATAERYRDLLAPHGMTMEAGGFPATVDDLARLMDAASAFPPHHIGIQPNIRLRTVAECAPIIEGWLRLAEQVDYPVVIETHRDRMTNDMFFMLDLLDAYPELKLLGDLSHYVVAREFALPVTAVSEAHIGRILDHCWAFHGRVASSEQVQVEISFPHHRPWLDVFLRWWEQGFRSWRGRAGPDASLAFTCELGPKPYAISGPDGNDLSDRWQESQMMRDHVVRLWDNSAA